MLAIDLLNHYLANHPYGVSDGHAAQLRWSLESYMRFCGSDGLRVLDIDLANRWIDDLRATRRPDTVRTQRGNLLTLWWHAYREQLVEEPPLRIRRLRPIARSPEAWTICEVRRLFDAAQAERVRPLFWESLIRCAYDTALRLGDLLALRAGATNLVAMPQTVWRITQHKTGIPLAVQLREQTAASLALHGTGLSASDVIWPLWGRRETFYRHFSRLVVSAAIRPGTFKWLRRTAVTQLELVAPGQGTRLAGHLHRSTTEQWYIDRSQLMPPPLPPL